MLFSRFISTILIDLFIDKEQEEASQVDNPATEVPEDRTLSDSVKSTKRYI